MSIENVAVHLWLTYREKKYEAEFSSDGSTLKYNNLSVHSITEFCDQVTGRKSNGQTLDKVVIVLNGKPIAKYGDIKLKLTEKREKRLRELYYKIIDPNSLKQLLEKSTFKPSQMVPPPKSSSEPVEIVNIEEVHVELVLELEKLCESLQTTAMLLTYMGTTEDSEDVRQEIKNQRKITNGIISSIEEKLELLQNHPQYPKLNNDFIKLKSLREEYFKVKLKQLLEKYPSSRSLTDKNINSTTRKAVKVEKDQLFELLQKPSEGNSYSQEEQQLLLQQDDLVFVPYQEDEEELKELQKLHKDLRDLYGISQDLHEEVAVQGEKIIQVQSNVDKAELSVKQGTRYLQEAKKIGAISAIVVGGTVGGLILGGPIGAIVGLKAGVALGVSAGVGGLAVGATAGGLLAKFTSSVSNSISGAYSKVTAPFMAKKQQQLASSPPQSNVNLM
ncbi:hypothetical protein NAEGRDRAFT_57153 [Naegleria gruberi]|uniref:t-SNARE coiled-coil homology domain-containing protein n=1 Tax=Naegleria gruberi TaxID=5762 RepID=D2V4Y2_NAEGR|nr:uncharacterized protein NAEGRDRAFT_57153 [Naegleria gruberi]EFC48183.1 hypothetical protein NAEGRDRAFT_57153 [Naegleria gruberi]|eukprot:XP_002680927.1 hypothetical protein NAEGRDRAFT_57153 [Naegleria gruberi strain NEG-M]